MDAALVSTGNSTIAMGEALTSLHDYLRKNADHEGLKLLTAAERLMKDRSLVMSDLDTAAALNYSLSGFGSEKPSEQEKAEYRELIRVGEHIS